MQTSESDKLLKLTKQITETGEWILDPEKLKAIKSLCKKSDLNVQITFECIMAQLKKKHAQIRYSSLQLIDQLFERSKYFRDCLTEDFPLFTQLIFKNSPPPAQVAEKLRLLGIQSIKSWYVKYGTKYRQLSIAYDYLMDQGIMDDSLQTADSSQSSMSARKQAIQLNRYELLKKEIEDHLDIIQDNLTNMENCIEILIPKNDLGDDLDFDSLLRGEATPNQTKNEYYKDSISSHGLGSSRYKIVIDLSEESLVEDAQETEDNKIVYDQLREFYTLLETKHSKSLNHWINALNKMDINGTNKPEKEKFVRKLIDIKGNAHDISRKAKLLHIEVLPQHPKTIQSDDIEEEDFGDEVFESIDIAEYSKKKDFSSAKLPPTQRIFPLSFEPNMIEDATYKGPDVEYTEQSKDKQPQVIDSQKEELFKRAPVVEWGEDLYYWDKKNIEFNTSGIENSHRFLGAGEGRNEMPDHLMDQLRMRATYYPTKEYDLKACKHPLNKGGLCPRKDLKMCPFHGPIIPRDDLGRPTNPKDQKEIIDSDEIYSPIPQKEPDPEVMNNLWEILEEDSLNQSGQKRQLSRKRKVKKDQPKALIDVRKKTSTSYTRLEQQLNSKRTKKLVEEGIEYEREMKARNREADKWK